jgi:hypothetical protein
LRRAAGKTGMSAGGVDALTCFQNEAWPLSAGASESTAEGGLLPNDTGWNMALTPTFWCA